MAKLLAISRKRSIGLAVAGTLLAMTIAANAASPPEADPALVAEVQGLLKQMADPDFHIRIAASREAEWLPPEAIPLLEQALASHDLSAEVSMRLENIIPELRLHAQAILRGRGIAAAMESQRSIVLDAYEHGPYTNPRWDSAAEMALAMSVRPPDDGTFAARENAKIDAAFSRAYALGCKDPLLEFIGLQWQIAAGVSSRLIFRLGPERFTRDDYPRWSIGRAWCDLLDPPLAADASNSGDESPQAGDTFKPAVAFLEQTDQYKDVP